ncbi:MAG: P-loop NTPase fold protein [Pirellulaceae bacterium]
MSKLFLTLLKMSLQKSQAMSQEPQPLQPIKSLDGDKLDRVPFANKMGSIISQMKQGGVIAIDGDWGCGKTWFATKWREHLESKEGGGFKTCYIDAFKKDYLDDPFLVISSEIAKEIKRIEPGSEKKLLSSLPGVAAHLLPIAARVSINAVSRFALGGSDLAGQIQQTVEEATSAGESYFQKVVDNFEKDEEVFDDFKNHLRDFTRNQPRPLLLFVDELDRCRPTFAVSFLERIKHLFDIENVVFILMVNRVQLEKSIESAYGAIDAGQYLEKFVRLFFTMPQPRSDILKRFIQERFDSFGIKNSASSVFSRFFVDVKQNSRMSTRDIEKAIEYFLFSDAGTDKEGLVLAALLIMKLRFTDQYRAALSSRNPVQVVLNQISNLLDNSGARKTYESITPVIAEASNRSFYNALIFKVDKFFD